MTAQAVNGIRAAHTPAGPGDIAIGLAIFHVAASVLDVTPCRHRRA